jgi:hypothetical protein
VLACAHGAGPTLAEVFPVLNMNVSVALALRAELSRARAHQTCERLALFVLGLTDEGDLPAWELASELAPERVAAAAGEPACTMLVGAVSLRRLASTLHRAGERELSAALRSSDARGVPVVLVQDVVRIVKPLDVVEAEEAESMLYMRPIGSA